MISFVAIRRIFLVAFFCFAIASASASDSAKADAIKSNDIDNAKQAAQEVIKDTGVKEQFGKSENGNQLLDQAQSKASNKLNELADEADSNARLPDSKQLFLKNLQGKNIGE